MGKGVISFSLWAILATSAHAQSFPQPLPVEEIPAVVSLPNPVPTSWLYVHDLFFNSILDGRVVLVDPSNVGTPVKAQVRASQFGSFIANDRRGELYTAETFYSRLTRGDRTDAVTIWDRATLEPKGEILLPDGKRGQSVTQPATFQLANEGQWALLWNFTPASSVTVLDLEGRKILSEVDTPGCSLIYPTVQRSFYTLCGDGGLTSFSLKPDGSIARQSTSKPFNQIEADPMFMMHAKVGGAPPIPGVVSKFLTTPGGREYLIRVPGVAGAPLTDVEIAQVMNWMLKRFDESNLPPTFRPYSASEVARLRKAPLGTHAAEERKRLLAKIAKNSEQQR